RITESEKYANSADRLTEKLTSMEGFCYLVQACGVICLGLLSAPLQPSETCRTTHKVPSRIYLVRWTVTHINVAIQGLRILQAARPRELYVYDDVEPLSIDFIRFSASH